MALLFYDFGRQVFWSAAYRKGLIFLEDIVLGKPKVSQLNVAITSNQNVLRFQVSIENIHTMKVLKS